MTEEVVQDAPIIKSTILIQSASALVLFDSGSTHSFLAKAFLDKIGMRLDDLAYDLVMSTPSGAVFTTGVSEVYRCDDPTVYLVDCFCIVSNKKVWCFF